MKKTNVRKTLMSWLLALCVVAGFGAMSTSLKVSAEEASDFDCTYSVPDKKPYFQYGAGEVITYTEEEAKAAGIPEGYSGTVVSIKPTSSSASGSGILLDFTAWEVPIGLVESISFRFYLGENSKNTNGKPQLRISNHNGDGWVYQPGSTASVTGEWATETITRTNSSLDNLADAEGNLDKFELSVRVSAHVDFYIDSVTLKIAENDGVGPEISCDASDAISVALGADFDLNASAYDAQEKCAKTLEYIWEDGVELDENGTPNAAGEYVLTLRATDYFGNESTKTITVTVIEPDLEKPIIHLNFTEMYAQVGMIPTLNFEVTDNQNVAEIVDYWSEGALDKNGALTEGTHTYTVIAKDDSNNEATHIITVSVTKDEPAYDNVIDEEALSPRYTVTFDGENATICKYGEKVQKPADPVREDSDGYTYVFEGWYNGEEAWDFDNVVLEDINLTSKWSDIPLPEDSSEEVESSLESSEESDTSEESSESVESSLESAEESDIPEESSNQDKESSTSAEESIIPEQSSESIESSSDGDEIDIFSGCFGMMNFSVLLPALLCVSMLYRKKDDREE